MKLFRSKSEVGLALVIAVLVSVPITFWPRARPTAFYFEITMRSSLPGFAQLFYGVGSAVNEADSCRLPLEGDNQEVIYKFPLPEGRYASLRFDPTNRAGNTITLSRARVVDRMGNILRSIRPEQFKPSHQIQRLEASTTEVTLRTVGNDGGSNIIVELGEPLVLKNFSRESVAKVFHRLVRWFLGSSALGLLAAPVLLRK